MLAGALEIQLAADVARLSQDMTKARTIVESGAKAMQTAANTATKAIAGLAAGLSLAAFASFVKGAINAAESLHDLSIQTGATVEALSGLAAVGKTTGTTAQNIADMMTKLARNLAGAREEGKGTGKALEALGVNFNDFKRLKPEEQFVALAKAMDGYADGAGKAAAIQAIMGKGAAANLPFFKDLAVAGELHAKVTSEQAAQADNFNDNLIRLKASGEAWKKELAMALLPVLDETVQALIDVTNGSGGLRSEVKKLSADGSIAEWARSVVTAGTYVLDMFTGIKAVIRTVGQYLGALMASNVEVLGSIAEAYFKVKDLDFSGAWAAMTSGVAKQKTIWSSLGESVDAIWSEKTLGTKIRDRISEMQALGKVAEKTKKQVNFQNTDDGKEDNEALKERLRLEKERMDFGRKQAIQAVKDMHDRHEAERKAFEELARAEEKHRLEREKSDQQAEGAYRKTLTALEDEAANWKLLESQIAAVKLAKMEQALAGIDPQDDGRESLARQIESQRKIVELLKGKELRDANEKAAEEAARAWARVGEAFVDNLMRGGKSVAQYLKDLFRTLVLRPILSPIGTAMGAMVGALPTAANAQGSGILGQLGTSALGTYLQGGINGIGSAFMGGLTGAGAMSGLSAAGAGGALTMGGNLAAAGTMVATDLTGATVLAGAAGGAGTGSIMAGVSGALSAIPVWGWAAMAAIAIFGMLKNGGGPKVDGVSGLLNSGIGIGGTNAQSNATAAQAAGGLQAQYDAMAKALGIKGGLQFGLGFSADPQGKSPTFVDVTASRNGQTAFTSLNRNVGRSQEELTAAISQMSSAAILKGLQQSDLEGQIGEWLRDLGDIDSLSDGATVEAIQRLNTYAEQKKQIDARLFELTATEAEKLARVRENETAAIDETHRAALQRIYALEDEKTATEKATAAAEKMRDRLMGMASSARSLARGFADDKDLSGVIAAQIAERLNAAGLNITADQVLGGTKAGFVDAIQQLHAAGNLDGVEAMLEVGSDFLELLDHMAEPASKAADELARVQQELMGLGQDIYFFVRDLKATRAGTATPGALLAGQQSSYLQDLRLARGGDTDALRRVQGSASAYIDAQKGMTASGSMTQAVIDQVISELSSLPAVRSYEAQSLDLLTAVVDGLAALPANLAPVLAENFDKLDLNVSGGLDLPELQAALAGKATDAQLQQMLMVLDANGDGQISRLELIGGKQDGTNMSLQQLLMRIGSNSILAYSAAEMGGQYAAINFNTGLTAQYAAQTAQAVFANVQQTASAAWWLGVIHEDLVTGRQVTQIRMSSGSYFAAGGDFGGGLRMVGERGPELEVTGPSRIYSASQTRSMLAGAGSDSAEVVTVLRELQAEIRANTRVTAEGALGTIEAQRQTTDATRTVAAAARERQLDPVASPYA